MQSPLSYAAWGPVFFNLLWLPALLFIFHTATEDRRLSWLAVWFFYLGNWIGQDYFSPQALAYFLYLVVLAICLAWFRAARPDQTSPSSGLQRRWAVLRDRLAAGASPGVPIDGAAARCSNLAWRYCFS